MFCTATANLAWLLQNESSSSTCRRDNGMTKCGERNRKKQLHQLGGEERQQLAGERAREPMHQLARGKLQQLARERLH
jgi:hypothetical protein